MNDKESGVSSATRPLTLLGGAPTLVPESIMQESSSTGLQELDPAIVLRRARITAAILLVLLAELAFAVCYVELYPGLTYPPFGNPEFGQEFAWQDGAIPERAAWESWVRKTKNRLHFRSFVKIRTPGQRAKWRRAPKEFVFRTIKAKVHTGAVRALILAKFMDFPAERLRPSWSRDHYTPAELEEFREMLRQSLRRRGKFEKSDEILAFRVDFFEDRENQKRPPVVRRTIIEL